MNIQLRIFFTLTLLLPFFFLSCGKPFVKKEEQNHIRNQYCKPDDKIYKLKKRLAPGNNLVIKSGTKVKVIIKFAKEWIKVYAFKASEEKVKAHPVLALFITKNEAPLERFDKKDFTKKFNEIFQLSSGK